MPAKCWRPAPRWSPSATSIIPGCAAYHVQRKRRLTRRFRPVDFDDTTARQTAHAKRDVEAESARRNHLHLGRRDVFTKTHDAAFAKLLFNGGNGQLDGSVTTRVAHRR